MLAQRLLEVVGAEGVTEELDAAEVEAGRATLTQLLLRHLVLWQTTSQRRSPLTKGRNATNARA